MNRNALPGRFACQIAEIGPYRYDSLIGNCSGNCCMPNARRRDSLQSGQRCIAHFQVCFFSLQLYQGTLFSLPYFL